MAPIVTHDSVGELSQSKMRELRFIRALQTDRSTIIVGPYKEPFKVSRDLLIQCSPTFHKLCKVPFKERDRQIVKLPGVDPSVFQDFVIWLHSPTPSVPLDRDPESLINLGIFAETYFICHLTNQISDSIRLAASKGMWKPGPEVLRTIYSGTSTSSTLRRLCSLILTVRVSRFEPCFESEMWKSVFIDFADLGWECFRCIQTEQKSTKAIMSKGACRFHDHLDVFGWVDDEASVCPFPEGAPPMTIPNEDLPATRIDSGEEKLWDFGQHKYTVEKESYDIQLDRRVSAENDRLLAISNTEPLKATDEASSAVEIDSGHERRAARKSKMTEKKEKKTKSRLKSHERPSEPVSQPTSTKPVSEPVGVFEELVSVVEKPGEAAEEEVVLVEDSAEVNKELSGAFDDFLEVVRGSAEAV